MPRKRNPIEEELELDTVVRREVEDYLPTEIEPDAYDYLYGPEDMEYDWHED